MKQKSLLFGLLSFFVMTVFAKQVDENTAKQVAQNFLATRIDSQRLNKATNLELVYKPNAVISNQHSSNEPSTFFYVFNTGSGFVIVSGDDSVTPILGYSTQGVFDPNNLPPNVAEWLDGYKAEISYVIERNIQATGEITNEWLTLKNGSNGSSSAKTTLSVNPLMQTQWDQSPYYNALCPHDSVTGCVATAMAQVMKYWNYPATGSGFHSYNHDTYGTLSANFGSTTYQWDSMPNVLDSDNDAVATLMYHLGVSVDMDYSPEFSGAYVIENSPTPEACSEYALKTYFGYKPTLEGVERDDYTPSQWINLLKTELDEGRPILYVGFGNGGGHAFVADGYDTNNYFHFNWGWGGYYDGYFQIDALNPGDVGTGGGSGDYNYGQQAVIGVEPPADYQTYDMALYNYVTPSETPIYYGQAFSVATNIVNNGANDFDGDYCAAIFDYEYNLIDFVEIKTGLSLPGGSSYNDDLVFQNTGLFSMLPGTYLVGVFYRPTGGNWIEVSNSANYTNFITMDVINPNAIELNSEMIVSPGSILVQGESASVNLNIINEGATTFFGEYSVELYNLEGIWVQTIGTITENAGLPAGSTYGSPYLTFSTPSIDVNPGSYFLALQHNSNNTGWELTGSSYYSNPIRVTVISESLEPDMYEANNTVGESFNLPVNFSEDDATVTTLGSNCHVTSDNDFYKIVLEPDYNYTIAPRLHDSYNSGNGNTYTLDGLFSFSTDGSNWSEAYDDEMNGIITLSEGGTVYFWVAPYFAGETGTYLLDMSLTRTSTAGIGDNQTLENIKIYPNPAQDFVVIDFGGFKGELDQLNLLNVQGQTVFAVNVIDSSTTFKMPLTNLSNGIYFLRMQTDSGSLTKKIIISK